MVTVTTTESSRLSYRQPTFYLFAIVLKQRSRCKAENDPEVRGEAKVAHHSTRHIKPPEKTSNLSLCKQLYCYPFHFPPYLNCKAKLPNPPTKQAKCNIHRVTRVSREQGIRKWQPVILRLERTWDENLSNCVLTVELNLRSVEIQLSRRVFCTYMQGARRNA